MSDVCLIQTQLGNISLFGGGRKEEEEEEEGSRSTWTRWATAGSGEVTWPVTRTVVFEHQDVLSYSNEIHTSD